jgi:catechol 2,3-dioxygenase-like lactoylglutathione lyase family enzyme
MSAHFILYVNDQSRSERFYRSVLAMDPRLSVAGMTEFDLPGGGVLGLMPEQNIHRLLGAALPDPAMANGIPRAELYLLLSDAGAFHQRALSSGAMELSPVMPRNWGHTAGYSLDPDGHVLTFATGSSEDAT